SIAAAVVNSGARKCLDDTVARLTASANAQDGGHRFSKGETSKGRMLRRTLRLFHMRPIAATAKVKLRAVPEVSMLTMPSVNATASKLLTAASSMADAADKHAQVFFDLGFPNDFTARLRAAADAVRQSFDLRTGFRDARAGATGGLAAEEAVGRA